MNSATSYDIDGHEIDDREPESPQWDTVPRTLTTLTAAQAALVFGPAPF